jgi:hypothetical protein
MYYWIALERFCEELTIVPRCYVLQIVHWITGTRKLHGGMVDFFDCKKYTIFLNFLCATLRKVLTATPYSTGFGVMILAVKASFEVYIAICANGRRNGVISPGAYCARYGLGEGVFLEKFGANRFIVNEYRWNALAMSLRARLSFLYTSL